MPSNSRSGCTQHPPLGSILSRTRRSILMDSGAAVFRTGQGGAIATPRAGREIGRGRVFLRAQTQTCRSGFTSAGRGAKEAYCDVHEQ